MNHAVSLDRFGQRSLACALMGCAASHLGEVDRTLLWVKIGAGELEDAMITLVGTCMRNLVSVPTEVSAALQEWLHGYSGTEVAASFESYVGLRVNDAVADGGPLREDTSNRGRFTDWPRRVADGWFDPAMDR